MADIKKSQILKQMFAMSYNRWVNLINGSNLNGLIGRISARQKDFLILRQIKMRL